MVNEEKVYAALVLDFSIVRLFEGYDMDEIVDMAVSYMSGQYKQYEESKDYLLLELDEEQYAVTSEYLVAHDFYNYLQEAEDIMFGDTE